jgi:hypothetical protein
MAKSTLEQRIAEMQKKLDAQKKKAELKKQIQSARDALKKLK